MYPIDFFLRAARRHPDRLALEGRDGRFTFSALADRVTAAAVALQAIDPAPGGRVGICCYNTVDHVVALLATLAAEKTWIPLNPRNGREELDNIIAMARPTALVVADACQGRFSPVPVPTLRADPEPDATIVQPGRALAEAVAEQEGRQPERRYPPLDAVQAIKFTSGSSGNPKGVLQPYRSWNAHCVSIGHAFGFDATERFMAAAPITHGTSCFLLPVLAAGGCVVVLERAKPDTILDAFVNRNVTGTYLTPTMIYNLMAQPGVEAMRFPRLRHLIYSGAPMRLEQIRQAMRIFPDALETCYGQAEVPQIIAYLRASDFADERNHSAVGWPGELAHVAIMADDGSIRSVGQSGEIVVRGDLTALGYLDNPDATAATFVDGWVRTGDLGRIDPRGMLTIIGRRKEAIISGGFNVYPKDVEDVLGAHPAVHECAVFGIDDPKWGEAVHAAVELAEGAEATEDDLIGFVKARLDSVKAPKRIHILADLPRNAVGKVVRRETKAQVEALLGPVPERQPTP